MGGEKAKSGKVMRVSSELKGYVTADAWCQIMDVTEPYL